jgi:hypothetical protein
MSWRVAASIADLRNELNAAYPGRSTATDGTIGDAAHQADPTSDHNPFVQVGGVGVVRAFDITTQAWSQGLADHLFDLGRQGDSRIRDNGYVIFNRRITNQDWSGWHDYNGSDPHTGHIHLSVGMTGFDDRGAWGIADVARPAPAPQSSGGGTGIGLPGWSLPGGHYYGNIAGPNESHGGYNNAERGVVQAIQRKFIALGCVPGQSDPNSGWADGKWENATDAACQHWFNVVDPRPAQQFTTRLYADDYAVLNTQ